MIDLNTIVSGLIAGSFYALVAVGFNILYRPTNVFNFAQGDLVMVGAMTGATVISVWLLPWPVAVLCAFLIVGAIAFLEERIAVRPIIKRTAHAHTWIITTLAFALIITNLVTKIWGPDPILVAPPWPLSMQSLIVEPFRLSSYQLAVFVFTIALVICIERFYRTRHGKAVLAMAEDRDAALLRGVNPDRLSRWSFVFGGCVAALTGIVAAPIFYASPDLGPMLLVKGFEAAAVGGIGNNRGALLAGYMLGLAEAFGAGLLSPAYQELSTFILLLVVLMIRPAGLFGQLEARRV